MVGMPTPLSPTARDSAPPAHPGWPRSPFRGGKDEEAGAWEEGSAGDSWSIRSEYGSTLDGDDTRAIDVLDPVRANENGDPHSEEPPKEDAGVSSDDEAGGSELGLQSHWDSVYAEELATFHEHGQAGEIWFGSDVMETMADWTTRLAAAVAAGEDPPLSSTENAPPPGEAHAGEAADWHVLDVGCGNGLLLHALAKRGFRQLMGSDYSEAGIALARSLAARERALADVTFVVDDVLASQLQGPFDLVVDKGTLDAIGLHPTEAVQHRRTYQQAVAGLLRPGGLLVITSCNSTSDELITEFAGPKARSPTSNGAGGGHEEDAKEVADSLFEYVGHVRTYPVYRFGGSVGSRVCTVAFRKKVLP